MLPQDRLLHLLAGTARKQPEESCISLRQVASLSCTTRRGVWSAHWKPVQTVNRNATRRKTKTASLGKASKGSEKPGKEHPHPWGLRPRTFHSSATLLLPWAYLSSMVSSCCCGPLCPVCQPATLASLQTPSYREDIRPPPAAPSFNTSSFIHALMLPVIITYLLHHTSTRPSTYSQSSSLSPHLLVACSVMKTPGYKCLSTTCPCCVATRSSTQLCPGQSQVPSRSWSVSSESLPSRDFWQGESSAESFQKT